MGWQDILKNRSQDMAQDMAQEILISFREFTPIDGKKHITKEEEDRVLSTMSNMPPQFSRVYKKTLEFMKPFDEIKRDGLNFVFKFDIEGVPFTLKMPFMRQVWNNKGGIGAKVGDTFPTMDSTGMRFCVKAKGEMTNGDFMVTLLLASKNNQLPAILTLPAYVERHMPETKMHSINDFITIYDSNEQDYKDTLLEQIWRHVEQIDETEWPPLKMRYGDLIDDLNGHLVEYIPKELLRRW